MDARLSCLPHRAVDASRDQIPTGLRHQDHAVLAGDEAVRDEDEPRVGVTSDRSTRRPDADSTGLVQTARSAAIGEGDQHRALRAVECGHTRCFFRFMATTLVGRSGLDEAVPGTTGAMASSSSGVSLVAVVE